MQMRTLLMLLLLVHPVRADELAGKLEEVDNQLEYKQTHWGILIVDAKIGAMSSPYALFDRLLRKLVTGDNRGYCSWRWKVEGQRN